eukprot:m.100099 g.100099  ORF g.100099 m.100099 type:complete len:201 (+) comp20649_c0_seq8:291-893(+)
MCTPLCCIDRTGYEITNPFDPPVGSGVKLWELDTDEILWASANDKTNYVEGADAGSTLNNGGWMWDLYNQKACIWCCWNVVRYEYESNDKAMVEQSRIYTTDTLVIIQQPRRRFYSSHHHQEVIEPETEMEISYSQLDRFVKREAGAVIHGCCRSFDKRVIGDAPVDVEKKCVHCKHALHRPHPPHQLVHARGPAMILIK